MCVRDMTPESSIAAKARAAIVASQKLKREFQLTPTMPTGGISVPPAVALGLVDELIVALEQHLLMCDVIAAARDIYDPGEYDHGHGGDGEGCAFCVLGRALHVLDAEVK